MKTAIWSLVAILGLFLVLIVGSSAMVYARQGIDNFEAYTLALQALAQGVIGIAQAQATASGGMIKEFATGVIALFNSATAP